MILGGKAVPAAAKPCAVHQELEARLARIEACVAALEKALGAGERMEADGVKTGASARTSTGASTKGKARTAAAKPQ
jgi:hypothetical protein